jgi:CBS domain-containing protein
VAGPLDAQSALDDVVRQAPRQISFLKQMARQATARRPPTGFFRDLVVESAGEHAGTLDVKRGGITLVTVIARVLALAAGAVESRTLDRLRAAVVGGTLDEVDRAGLEESFRLLWAVRLEHQVRQWREGKAPDDFVDPHDLGPLTRQGLKEAFRTIDRVQRALVVEYGLRLR